MFGVGSAYAVVKSKASALQIVHDRQVQKTYF